MIREADLDPVDVGTLRLASNMSRPRREERAGTRAPVRVVWQVGVPGDKL